MAEKFSFSSMGIGDIIKAFYDKSAKKIYFAKDGDPLANALSATYYQYVQDSGYIDDHATSKGYFYFVKVLPKVLVADRIIDRQISYNDVLTLCKNALPEYKTDLLTLSEFYKFLTASNIYGSWLGNTAIPLSRSDIAYYYSYRTVVELMKDTSGTTARINLNRNTATLNTTVMYREATSNNPSFFANCPLWVDKATSHYTTYPGGGATTLHAYMGFRPKITLSTSRMYEESSNAFGLKI